MSYTTANVGTVRKRFGIPARDRNADPAEGEPLTVAEAARQLGISNVTLHRWINDGVVPAEQLTPGAPWRIRLTDQTRALLADSAPPDWVPMQVATRALGVSRQTVLQRVKRGDLRAVHIRTGRRKGLRIEIPTPQDGLF